MSETDLDLRSHLVFIKDQIEWCEGCVIDRDENDNPVCVRDYCSLDDAKHWLDMFIELEKDSGCPLDVVLNGLKGINYEDASGDFWYYPRPRLYYSDDLECWCWELYLGGYVLPLKDYKKTWWIYNKEE